MLRPGSWQRRWERLGGWQGRESRDWVAQEWIRLTLTEDTAGAAAAKRSPPPFPHPRAAADCGGIPAPRLCALPRRCGTRGAGAAGWRGCPSSLEGRRRGRGRRWGGGEGGRSRGAATRRSRIGGPAADPARLLGFPGRQQPLPRSRLQGMLWPSAEQGRAGAALSLPC